MTAPADRFLPRRAPGAAGQGGVASNAPYTSLLCAFAAATKLANRG
jgi:hypothetical protein